MADFIKAELSAFERDCLIPNGEPPLTEEETDTYGSCMAATWAALTLQFVERLRGFAKEHPACGPAILKLAEEVIRTLPAEAVHELDVLKAVWGPENDIPPSGTVH